MNSLNANLHIFQFLENSRLQHKHHICHHRSQYCKYICQLNHILMKLTLRSHIHILHKIKLIWYWKSLIVVKITDLCNQDNWSIPNHRSHIFLQKIRVYIYTQPYRTYFHKLLRFCNSVIFLQHYIFHLFNTYIFWHWSYTFIIWYHQTML